MRPGGLWQTGVHQVLSLRKFEQRTELREEAAEKEEPGPSQEFQRQESRIETKRCQIYCSRSEKAL